MIICVHYTRVKLDIPIPFLLHFLAYIYKNNLTKVYNLMFTYPYFFLPRMESTEKCEVVIQHFNGKYLKTPPGIPGKKCHQEATQKCLGFWLLFNHLHTADGGRGCCKGTLFHFSFLQICACCIVLWCMHVCMWAHKPMHSLETAKGEHWMSSLSVSFLLFGTWSLTELEAGHFGYIAGQWAPGKRLSPSPSVQPCLTFTWMLGVWTRALMLV